MNKKVLVGIVGYKSEQYIYDCITSILKQTYPSIQIVYFDNYGLDKAVSIVQSNFKNVICIRSSENLGYGRSHNWIINNHEFDFYMPLNPDVILSPDFLTEAVKALHSTQDKIGSVNGLVLHLKGEDRTEVIYSCGHIMHKDRRIDNLFSGMKTTEVDLRSRRVFGPNGACPLLKKEAIQDISIDNQFFDPLFFMYGDDIDIGWRMSKAGWKTVFSPQCKAWHSIGGSNPFQNRKIRSEYIANRYILIMKNDRLSIFLKDLPYILFIESFFFLIHSIKRPAFAIDFIFALFKVIKSAPYAFKTRKNILNRSTLKEEKGFIEKNYSERVKSLYMRQSSKRRNLSTFR